VLSSDTPAKCAVRQVDLRGSCWRCKVDWAAKPRRRDYVAVWRDAVWRSYVQHSDQSSEVEDDLCAYLLKICVDISCIRGGVCWCNNQQSPAPYIFLQLHTTLWSKTLIDWAAHQVNQVEKTTSRQKSSEDSSRLVNAIPSQKEQSPGRRHNMKQSPESLKLRCFVLCCSWLVND
jgi:hypothetical protein